MLGPISLPISTQVSRLFVKSQIRRYFVSRAISLIATMSDSVENIRRKIHIWYYQQMYPQPARRVSYRGTEAQPNPPQHQGSRQPPDKPKNEEQPPHKPKAETCRITSGREKKTPTPHPQGTATKAAEQRTQVVVHTPHT